MKKIKHYKQYKKTYKSLIIILITIITSLSIGYSAFNTNIKLSTKGNVVKGVWSFDYTGSVQTFTAPKTGTYKLETWGASSGYTLNNNVNEHDLIGYGGYSIGTITIQENSSIYISVGGQGENGLYQTDSTGGWNGGGNGTWDHCDDESTAGGGGATSIQNTLIDDGQLKNYEQIKSIDVLIVSGGGGSTSAAYSSGRELFVGITSSGGGFKGVNGLSILGKKAVEGGSQESGYAFGQGENAKYVYSNSELGAGGGGFYGGYAAIVTDLTVDSGRYVSGGGGSGYIGNANLKEKHMACYNCETSDEEDTKTISVTCANEEPTENCAKIGNGYAKITLLKK